MAELTLDLKVSPELMKELNRLLEELEELQDQIHSLRTEVADLRSEVNTSASVATPAVGGFHGK